MRITILTAGTRGDTQPYIALALGLQQADFQVRFAGFEDFESLVKGYGLEFFPLRVNISAMMNSNQGQSILGADKPLNALLKQMQALRAASTVLDQMQEDIWWACQGADAIIYHPGLINGYFIARYLGIPCCMASAIPMSPTRQMPSLLFYNGPRLGGSYNLFTHKLFEQIFWHTFRSSIQTFWRKRGLSIPFHPPYSRQRTEGLPVLYGYSEHVLPRPADWPAHFKVTGYWFLDAASDWQPPAALTDFIQCGPPPVYIGFGSMGGNTRRAQETTELVIQALTLSGQRGLLASGWNGLTVGLPLPEHIFMVDEAPHAWLFPQMAAVVHHGGAGTSAAGMRAGVPTVVVPHTVDQPMWGKRIAELGVGPQPIPRKQLTAENLAAAITSALHKEPRIRAEALGTKIRAENGIVGAVGWIDQYMKPH